MKKPLNLVVFPGIGDISWVYSKLGDLLEERDIRISIYNCGPQRGEQFLRLLPGITPQGYIQAPFTNYLPMDADLRTLNEGPHNIIVNPFIEQGHRIETVWPKQTIDYHYPLQISDSNKEEAKDILLDAEDKKVFAFYATSYNHRSENGFWSVDNWTKFLLGAEQIYGNKVAFLALGAGYDKKTFDVAENLRGKGAKILNLVGQTDMGVTLELIRLSAYMFSFPSGLGVLSDVLDTPGMMWYWKDTVAGIWGGTCNGFLNQYADPKNVESGRHLNMFFNEPEEALKIFEERGLKWI